MFPTEKPLDNPINWSFRVGRLFAIDIRVHVAFLICAVVLVWMQMPDKDAVFRPSMGSILIDALGIYAILFVVVLLHEFGHCFGARRTGGDADEILIWPLGGLAYTNPPHNATAHMITTIAGPAVNIIICMLCTVVLVLWTGSLGGVPWNPLNPMWPVDSAIHPTTAQLWLMRVFGISYLLLLFNLLPIFPFDGGRMVQSWLWPKKGYRRSMEIATSTGMIGAIVVGLFGLFTGEGGWLMIMIAVFGYLTCYRTKTMLRETGDFGEGEFGYDFSQGYTSLARGGSGEERRPGYFARRRAKKAAQKAERERQAQVEHEKAVERILAKISRSGLESLTPRERNILQSETDRQRTLSDGSSEESG